MPGPDISPCRRRLPATEGMRDRPPRPRTRPRGRTGAEVRPAADPLCARRLLAVAAALALSVCGCAEVEDATVVGYQPATVEEIDGSDLKHVTLTREGAARTGLRTRRVERHGRHVAVPYASVIYDGEGTSYVYVSPRPLTFRRAEITIARVSGPRAILTAGPKPGTEVVTVGTTEVYGAELEIAGGH
jgi:hypothetical protein